MISAIMTKMFASNIAEYNSFLIASGFSLIGCILGTLLTKPTEDTVLVNFYKITRPFGFWNQVRSNLEISIVAKINQENRRDIIAIFFAVPWQVTLFLTTMMIVLKQWTNFINLFGMLIILSFGLYWFWFRHLSKEVRI